MKKTEHDWQLYRTRFLVKARQLNRAMTFTDSLGREHCGSKGDYLVESCDGIRSIAPRKIFEDVYVTIGPATARQALASGLSPQSIHPAGRRAHGTNVENQRSSHASRRLIA